MKRKLKTRKQAKLKCPSCKKTHNEIIREFVKHEHKINGKMIKETHNVLTNPKIACCGETWTFHDVYATSPGELGTTQIPLK